MRQAIIVMACCMLGIPVWGQFNLSGYIRDVRGEALAGAAVVINNSYLGATSGVHGEYEFKNLKGGNYTVQVSFLGYTPVSKAIDIRENSQLDFVLESSSILGDEVVVKATRMTGGETAANERLDKKKIVELNQGEDIPFILGLTPSLVATSDAGTGIGYTNLKIRGTDSYRINVTVNGIPMNDAESHGVWWVNMPDFISSTDNIHVQRGVGASTNGAGAFGGTISMQSTTLNREPYAEAGFNGGSFNTWQRNVLAGTGLINNRFTLDMRLSWLDSDGYIDRAFSHLKSWYVSGASYGKGSILRFNAFSGTEKTYQAWYGVEKSILDTNRTWNPYTYDNETDNYTQTHYQLLYSKELSQNIYLNTALHYTHGEGYYESFVADDSLSHYDLQPLDTFYTSDLITRRWLDNDFYGMTYSLNYRKAKLDMLVGGGWNNYLGNHFGQVIWAKWAANNEIRHEYYRGKGNKADFNTFFKISYKPKTQLNIYADLQYRRVNYSISGIDDYLDANGKPVSIDQVHQFNFINPKFGLYYHPSEQAEYYFTFSTGHREPTRSNYVDATLQTDKPRPETLYDFEWGTTRNIEDASWNLNIYYMDYKDQLVHTGRLNEVAYPIMINVPKSYRLGVEVSADWKINPMLDWNANLTLSQNKILKFMEYADYYDSSYNYLGNLPRDLGTTDISYSPSVTGSSLLNFKPVSSLQIALLSKYVGSQYFDNTSSRDRKLQPYLVNDLNIRLVVHPKWIKEIEMQFQVLNLLDELYESNAYGGNWYENNRELSWSYWFPQAGRHYMAGLKIRF